MEHCVAEALDNVREKLVRDITRLAGAQSITITGLVRYDKEGRLESERFLIMLPELGQAAEGASYEEAFELLKRKYYLRLVSSGPLSSRDDTPERKSARTSSYARTYKPKGVSPTDRAKK